MTDKYFPKSIFYNYGMFMKYSFAKISFLSPAHRGNGNRVAPGFRQASCFFLGAKTSGQFF